MTHADEEVFEIIGEFTEDTQYLFLPFWKVYRRAFKKFVGLELRVTITPLRYKRSLAQNSYYWSVINPMVQKWLYETQGERYSPDHVSVWLRTAILGEVPEIIEIAGMECVRMTSKRFSEMSTKVFASAVDKIRAEMSIRGLDIPEPSKDKTKHNMLHEFLKDT